jgi:hypothetical protein
MDKRFLRSGAVCVLAGAVLLSIGYLLRTDIDKKYIDEFASRQALVSTILVGVGSLIFLFGLPVFFVTQKLYSSVSGIAASALSFTGIAGFHLGTLALYFVTPVLVTHNQATRALMYSDEPPFPFFALFWAISLLVLVIGLFWIGIRGWRTAVQQKWSSVLFTLGALIFFCAPFIYFPLIKTANTVVMFGFAWWALKVLRD